MILGDERFFTREHFETHTGVAPAHLCELVVYSLELVSQLACQGLTFRFKGGNCQLVLLDRPEIGAADLPPELRAPAPVVSLGQGRTLQEVLAATEREMITAALLETGGNKSAACRLLSISRPTLDRKIADYRIEYR